MDKNIIGKRIKELRKQKKLTQKELADNIGVSRTTISKYEGGYFTPSYKQIDLLCKVLECEQEYLYDNYNDIDEKYVECKIFDYLITEAIRMRYSNINEYVLETYKRMIYERFNIIDEEIHGKLTGEFIEDEDCTWDDFTSEEKSEIIKDALEYFGKVKNQ